MHRLTGMVGTVGGTLVHVHHGAGMPECLDGDPGTRTQYAGMTGMGMMGGAC